MAKILIVVFVTIMLTAGGLYAWKSLNNKIEVPAAPVTQEPVPAVDTYASSTLGFSISYPKGYTVNDSYAYDQFGPKKLIHGVKFTIPMEMATGTNLSSDTGISVEWLPRAKHCTADIYLTADVPALKLTDHGVTYSIATSTGAGAGNFYEEDIYAIASSSPCTAIRYFIHSGNIDNYPPGVVREFDRTALLKEFDKIRQSLTFTQ